MKEYLVQNQIFAMCQNAKTKDGGQRFFNIVPNIMFFDWESDMLVMDNTDRMFEFEIKASRSDLLKDFEAKKDKHKALKQRKGRIPNFFILLSLLGNMMKTIYQNTQAVILFAITIAVNAVM